MRIGLFIPCYVDQFYPQVGRATVDVLQRFPDLQLEYPNAQTCCGQPMANTGCIEDARPLAERFVDIFSPFDHVVSPSGSCVSMVRNHFDNLVGTLPHYRDLKNRVWELTEFLVKVLQVDRWPVPFPHRVGLHSSCHGLRELRLDACSERVGEQPSVVRKLLQTIPQIELVELERPDECCGFGGTFAVAEEGVSVLMGADRLADHLQAGAEVVTATDTSCLMHLEGLARRRHLPLTFMHISQILAGDVPAPVPVEN
ncbi:MAG: (Fe-S)-binding protein [Planctomycetota bacterium]|nr:MAG: (Fe-S)-binding protein [Planctomycetota bacterium]